jgi:hypothetical protein
LDRSTAGTSFFEISKIFLNLRQANELERLSFWNLKITFKWNY